MEGTTDDNGPYGKRTAQMNFDDESGSLDNDIGYPRTMMESAAVSESKSVAEIL